MSKFYCVRIGRIPGIYYNWEDTKKQVHGFSGAQHKSFKSLSDANKYLNISKKTNKFEGISKKTNKLVDVSKSINLNLVSKLNKRSEIKTVNIYTDGSHQKTGSYIGYGAFCCYEDKEYKLSGNINKDLLDNYNIKGKVSNPTAEFIAFHQSLLRLDVVKNKLIIIFHIDYIGVSKWMTGQWKTKKDHIKKIKNKSIAILNNTIHEIKYKHVHGHSGVYGNEKADKLAKSFIEIDEFSRRKL